MDQREHDETGEPQQTADAPDTTPALRPENAAPLTRREWLLKLGEAAVLMGFSGWVNEGVASTPPPNLSGTPGPAPLPPGLYEPSNDHLTQALMSDALYHPIPAECAVDFVPLPNGPYRPVFFTPEEFQILDRLVSLMLGIDSRPSEESASAGHEREDVRAVVAQWIDLSVSSSEGVREAALRLTPQYRAVANAYFGDETRTRRLETGNAQKASRQGLEWLEKESHRRYQRAFLGLDQEDQVTILRSISDESPAGAEEENPGRRFFRLVKSEIIRGYYTSRTGLKELNYQGNAFHAESPGCPNPEHHAQAGGANPTVSPLKSG